MSERAREAKLSVLVVDDDPTQCELVQRSLSREGFDVVTTSSPIGVSNLVRSSTPDIVLLDLDLPAVPGDKLIELARKHAPQGTLFIFYSACDLSKLQRLATLHAADGWISKSTVGTQLAEEIRSLLAKASAP